MNEEENNIQEHSFKSRFRIGQKVFLNVSNSEQHVVSDIVARLRDKSVRYILMDNRGYRGEYAEEEISDDQTF